MNDLYLHKLSDNEYAIFGKKEYCYDNYSSVEIDGKTYTNRENIDAIMDMEEEYKKGKLNKITTNFLHYFGEKEITLYYKVWAYGSTIWGFARTEWSQNEMANYIMFLQEYKLLPKCINELYIGKGGSVYTYDIPKFELNILSYGYNNFVIMDIQYQYIVKYNIPRRLIESNLNRLLGTWKHELLLNEYPESEDLKIKQIQKFLGKTEFIYYREKKRKQLKI